MADVLVLSRSPAATGLLRRAVLGESAGGVFHTLRAAEGWADLAAMGSASAVAIAFVDPYHGGVFGAAEVALLRRRLPALEVVAYGDFTRRSAADAFALAPLGVREVVCAASDGAAAALARCLREHLNQGPLDRVAQALAHRVPPELDAWLRAVLLSAGAGADAAQLARAARCSPRTLRRVLPAAGLPGPERLLAWRCILHAARLLDDGRSAESVARTLELSSGSALRKSLMRLTGLRPRELRDRGGLPLACTLFLRACGVDDGGVAAPARRVAVADTGARRRSA
ncbi:MAG TPA: helix-turn-helix domain-containing protein [Longimicrobium sp.]|nr:helix-turn-helix domain-containing protein [Longimicrobium sp.]